MKTTIQHNGKTLFVDLSKPLDISIPLINTDKNPIAWYLEKLKIEPVVMGDWIAKVSKGASVNFNNISFNPHGHGTHTECVGHISKEFNSVNQALKTFFFLAEVISVTPHKTADDEFITKQEIEKALDGKTPEALVIRTLPNPLQKKSKQWSDTDWPYLKEDAAEFLRHIGVQHLLIDLPSVDKEKDDGKLLAHKAFWNYPENTRHNSTITEMIFVEDSIADGSYLLNLQMASFENDASPSKPVLYELIEVSL